jgi:DNA-binding transcriptional regulator GbsR (MarR family)
MGQQEVYDFLKKNKRKWYTSREISTALKLSIGSVTMSLKKLRNSKSLKYKMCKDRKNTYKYQFKK